jgi:hypothetical protein
MSSWTQGPFGKTPSYEGVRLTEDALQEFEGEQIVLSLPLAEIRRARLEHGTAAERPTVQLALGIVLLFGGGWAAWRVGGLLLADEGSLVVLGAAVCVGVAGLAVLASGWRRRFYLLIEMGADRRKLVFGRYAQPKGLALFLERLKRNGLQLELPADFTARSRFVKSSSTIPGLRTLHRTVDASGISSFSVSARDDSIFALLTSPLVEWLEQYLAGGAQVRDRDTLLCGMQLFLAEVNAGHLTLLAPGKQPEEWSQDLTWPLLVGLRQRFIAQSFDLPLDPPDPKLLVSVEETLGRGPVLMNRMTRDDEMLAVGHSGWCIWSLDGKSEQRSSETPETVHVSILDLASFRPDLLEWLALPSGFSVLEGDQLKVMRDDVELSASKGSYVHAKQHGITLPAHLGGSA